MMALESQSNRLLEYADYISEYIYNNLRGVPAAV